MGVKIKVLAGVFQISFWPDDKDRQSFLFLKSSKCPLSIKAKVIHFGLTVVELLQIKCGYFFQRNFKKIHKVLRGFKCK